MSEAERVEHEFSSVGRAGIDISGVKEVLSFDDVGVLIETVCGCLAVEGESLRITVLDLAFGKVAIVGRLNGVYYIDGETSRRKGLFGKKK